MNKNQREVNKLNNLRKTGKLNTQQKSVARIRWELANEIKLQDIVGLLEQGKITKRRADEAIRMRIAGNEPELPDYKEGQ